MREGGPSDASQSSPAGGFSWQHESCSAGQWTLLVSRLLFDIVEFCQYTEKEPSAP